MTASLAEILQTNSFLTLTADNKILCSITKHEMPPKLDVVLSHINGNKFKKTKEWYSYDYSEFEPYIVVDRQNSAKLHCKLTGQTLNKIPNEVKKHSCGKKFLRLKKENEELQKKEASKEKDVNPNIWVPPEELLEEEEDDVPNSDKGKKVIRVKVNTNNDADHVNDEEDDSFSDLLGSDHDDESDEDDEIEVDSESEFDAIEKKKSRVVNKIDKKDAANGEVPAKGFNNKDIQITEKKTNKNVKRKSDEDISSASSKKTKKGVAVSKEEFTEAKKISKKIKGVK